MRDGRSEIEKANSGVEYEASRFDENDRRRNSGKVQGHHICDQTAQKIHRARQRRENAALKVSQVSEVQSAHREIRRL